VSAFLASIGYARWALTALLVIPMAGAALLALFPAGAAKRLALVVSVVELVVSLGLWWAYDPGGAAFQLTLTAPWVPSWGISYYVGIDGISPLYSSEVTPDRVTEWMIRTRVVVPRSPRAVGPTPEAPGETPYIRTEAEKPVKLTLEEWMRASGGSDRFRREAMIAASFAHPNVVTVYDFGLAGDGRAFLVMELLHGTDLRGELRRLMRLPHHMKNLYAARTQKTGR